MFLGLKAYEYFGEFREHLIPAVNFSFPAEHAKGAELFFLFYFTATGLHGLHVLIGIVVLAAIARAASRHAYSARYHAPITVAGLSWSGSSYSR